MDSFIFDNYQQSHFQEDMGVMNASTAGYEDPHAYMASLMEVFNLNIATPNGCHETIDVGDFDGMELIQHSGTPCMSFPRNDVSLPGTSDDFAQQLLHQDIMTPLSRPYAFPSPGLSPEHLANQFNSLEDIRNEIMPANSVNEMSLDFADIDTDSNISSSLEMNDNDIFQTIRGLLVTPTTGQNAKPRVRSLSDGVFTRPRRNQNYRRHSHAGVDISSQSTSKMARPFWQYNLQSKGPKRDLCPKKLSLLRNVSGDPHVLKQPDDPVFDPVIAHSTEWNGICVQHTGKARRGNGNDLTADPKKLCIIGQELDELNETISAVKHSLEDVGGQQSARKEKNKLTSRVCRLKKKAQHEANKIKLQGLHQQHKELILTLEELRVLMNRKASNIAAGYDIQDCMSATASVKLIKDQNLRTFVCGRTMDYVDDQIDKAKERHSKISALISHRERLVKSERISLALSRVGQDVCDAVKKFVYIGENIASENVEIKQDMLDACREAREAGVLLAQIVSLKYDAVPVHHNNVIEERKLLRAARGLLSSVTKVLLLADKVIVIQILRAKDAVRQTLRSLVHVNNFSDFVKLFSRYGSTMVDLARLSGERLQDLKDDKRKAQLASARQVLEKSTMMLLTSSKASLRHPESQEARLNRDLVYARVNEALNLLSYAVTDGETYMADPEMRNLAAGFQTSYVPSVEKHTAISVVLQRIEDTLEMIKMNLITSEAYDILKRDFQYFEDALTDFIDSSEFPNEQRERILQFSQLLKDQVQSYPVLGLDSSPFATTNLDSSLSKSQQIAKNMKKELTTIAVQIATELLKNYNEAESTARIAEAALSGDRELLDMEGHGFAAGAARLLEVTRMLKHISTTPTMLIQADRLETSLSSLSRQCIFAAQTLVHRVGSRTAKENLDVFLEAWRGLVRDLLALTTQCGNLCKEPKAVRMGYMSLPRPGKHGSTAKPIRTVPTDFGTHEQARLVKNGLEMQMISSEMDSETEKWDEASNDIVKRAKNMSSMAYTMYLFTKGDGSLKTTQDLFTQAEFFTEEANRLCRAIRDFANQVPQGIQKVELVSTLDKIPSLIQHLTATIKNPTAGKTATFNKVETVIQQTKDLMNAIAKLVTTCFICATKYDLDYRHLNGYSSSPTIKWRLPTQSAQNYTGGSLTNRLPEDSDSVHSFKSTRSENAMAALSARSQGHPGSNSMSRLPK